MGSGERKKEGGVYVRMGGFEEEGGYWRGSKQASLCEKKWVGRVGYMPALVRHEHRRDCVMYFMTEINTGHSGSNFRP